MGIGDLGCDTTDREHLWDFIERGHKRCRICRREEINHMDREHAPYAVTEAPQQGLRRQEFKMSEEDLKTILDACKPAPLIALQTGMPASPQENANRAWQALGERMGFDGMTVEPVRGKGQRFFTAEIVEPPPPQAGDPGPQSPEDYTGGPPPIIPVQDAEPATREPPVARAVSGEAEQGAHIPRPGPVSTPTSAPAAQLGLDAALDRMMEAQDRALSAYTRHADSVGWLLVGLASTLNYTYRALKALDDAELGKYRAHISEIVDSMQAITSRIATLHADETPKQAAE